MSYDLWGRLRYVLSPQFDIYEEVAKVVSGEIADVGSGTGLGTHLLARNANVVTGYDVDEGACSFAQRTFSNGKVGFLRGSITAGIGIRGYDFVVMIDVIEHIREDSLAIQNCKRMLKKDGTLICSTPNKLSRYRKSEYHVREYSPQGLKALLGRSFDSVDILNFQLQPIESDYANPLIALCV